MDFCDVMCDEAITEENTIAGYENIGRPIRNASDAFVIPDHDVILAYSKLFVDQQTPPPREGLIVETYDRLYLDVAQSISRAIQDGVETQLRIVVTNTDENGRPGYHYFTVAYRIVSRRV